MFGEPVYGTDTSLIAQLRSGTPTAPTESWPPTTPGADNGPATSADLLDGETYDARARQRWAHGRSPATTTATGPRPSASLRHVEAGTAARPPVRVTQELDAPPARARPRRALYDLGQNMVGLARVKLAGRPARPCASASPRCSNPDGTLYTANLRGAKATDHYTFATDGTETCDPKFTFHGFRYVEITGQSTRPGLADDHRRGRRHRQRRRPARSRRPRRSSTSCRATSSGASAATSCRSRPTRPRATSAWAGRATSTSSPHGALQHGLAAFLTKWLQRPARHAERRRRLPRRRARSRPVRRRYGSAGWADAGVHVPVRRSGGPTATRRSSSTATTR